MEYYLAALQTLGLIVAILAYLHERNKREKSDSTLKATQQNTQQVSNNLQQVTNIITNKTSLTQEDIKNIAKEISLATTTTGSTLTLAAHPIAFASSINKVSANILRAKAVEGTHPSLDNFFEEHPELLTSEQKAEKSKKAFEDFQRNQNPK